MKAGARAWHVAREAMTVRYWSANPLSHVVTHLKKIKIYFLKLRGARGAAAAQPRRHASHGKAYWPNNVRQQIYLIGDIFRSDQTLTTGKMIGQNYGEFFQKPSHFGRRIKSGCL